MTREYRTNSPEETEALGEHLAPELAKAPVVALYGELGAGKTAFVRGLARAFACRQPVSSPTFALVNEYSGTRKLCHFDLYRLPDAEALWDIGWADYLRSGALCVVEWSERAEDAFPAGTASVRIERTGDSARKITVELC
ncbi:MAG: tRNA (adenosine(37)-N6)-threonylcarbamoyltransferase complex ATPase subunit type 1 TsaE [Clostridiaceae bacterium]|nr:tRNA (adenosine(37)-N6)-threonylcarbamoyltransferase complex ATPase subunit type 1 TsaE [Clostridiaceae bacterium]